MPRSPPLSGGSGGAPVNASFLVLGLDGTLTDERVLVGTAGRITATDGGVGGNLVIDVVESGIKLDDLGAPDDNTDLNATTLKHGLLRKLSGNAAEVLKGDGSWGGVAGSGDVVGPAVVVASEIALWDGTTGDLLKSATGTGLVEVSSGVYQTPVTVTAFAKTQLDDADADAGRTTLGLGALAVKATVATADIDNDAVTYAKIQNVSATDRLLGRDTAAAGDVEELTVGGGLEFTGTGGIQRSALTGDVTASAGSGATAIGAGKVLTAMIGDDQVTYAKVQDVSATDRILGRDTAGAGVIEELTTSAVLDMVGGTQGQVLYRGAATWSALAVGTNGQVLTSGGAAANPSWTTVAGTGDVVGPASSVASEIVLFDGTTGKLIKAATGTGLVKATSGVYSAATLVTADCGDAQITLAKQANLAASKIIGRATQSTGVPEAVGLGRHMAMDAAGVALDFDYDADTFSDWDEMFAFPSSGVLISKYLWTESLAGSGTFSVVTGVTKHDGVIRATTGTTSGNANRAFIGNSSTSAPILCTDMRKFLFRVSVGTITTVTVACGMGQDMAAASFGTAGVYFIFDPATSAFWQFVTRTASTSSIQTSDVTVNAGDWYDLSVTFDGTHWTPLINKAAHSLVASSATEPTSALNFGWVVATGTTAARTFDVDTIAWSLKALGNRYT